LNENWSNIERTVKQEQEGDACTTTLRQGKILKLMETQEIITLG